jgi:type II secretory pathway pseudopilin PulG
MATTRHDGPRAGGTKRSLLVAVALFVVLCGIGLALFGGRPDGAAQAQRRSATERSAAAALERAEQAERALMERDYGRAREHVRRARRLLAGITEDGRPTDERTSDH